MADTKYDWTITSALEIIQHPTIDSKTWSEAVEWLLLYGPPEMQQMLLEASGHATAQHYPGLKPAGFTENGEPCYTVASIADSLKISEEEALNILSEIESKHGVQQLFPGQNTHKIQ